MIKKLWAIALTILFASPLLAQQASITGKVVSAEDSTGLPGVSVVIKGTTQGTATDIDGNYSIAAGPGDVLVFSYIGFSKQEVRVQGQSVINITLKPDVASLSEVVVTGYTTAQRKDVISSISSINQKELKNLPVASFDQALQGKAPGVHITNSSGTPGGGVKIVIRGNTSISANNRPLIVVDGIPVEDGALSLRDFGGQNDNALALINFNDIENYEILKDAAAKAKYGSRGANGVILITTKRGKTQKTSINLDVQRGIIDPTNKVDLLNSTELLTLQREALVNADRDPDSEGYVVGVTDANNTDWIDEVLRRGIYQQYQINSYGGNERTKFYVSANYRDEEGIQLNNRFQRFQGTINLDHNATQKLSFGNNLMISRGINHRVKGDNFLDGVYSGAIKSLPYYTPYDEHGRLIGPGDPGYASFPNFNPVAQALLPKFETYSTKILAGLFANYEILKNLNFRSKVSIDFNSINEDQYESSRTAIGGFLQSVGGKGYGVYSSGVYSTLINTNTLTYNFNLKNIHNFQTLLGTEFLRKNYKTSGVQARLFPRDDFQYIDTPDGGQIATVDAGNSFSVTNGLASYFFELKYDFDGKYLASLNTRVDGSSRFGRNKRYGFFPAFSLGWRISSEKFMQQFNFLDDLKLRGSYGFTGNENIGDFEFLATFSGATYNGASGLAPENLGNPNLKWENTREINIGVDASVFNGRLGFTVEAYDFLTNDQLYAEPQPLTSGFNAVQGNVGNVSNKGLEVAVKTVNMDKSLKWNTSFNYSRNLNRVKSFADTLFLGYTATPGGRTNVVIEGQPLGTFWGLVFQGVDPATGDAIYEDRNGDGTITGADATVIGNAQPDFIAGMTNSFSYKGFDLTIFLQGSYGNEILNFNNSSLLDAGQSLENNQVREALKRWQKPGDITHIPRYEAENSYNNYHSSRFIEDGSYLRLKNVTLSYNIPSSWIERYFVSSARIYASGSNLYTVTRYTGNDPEVNTLDGSTTAQGIDFFTLPQVRTIMLGLSIGF